MNLPRALKSVVFTPEGTPNSLKSPRGRDVLRYAAGAAFYNMKCETTMYIRSPHPARLLLPVDELLLFRGELRALHALHRVAHPGGAMRHEQDHPETAAADALLVREIREPARDGGPLMRCPQQGTARQSIPLTQLFRPQHGQTWVLCLGFCARSINVRVSLLYMFKIEIVWLLFRVVFGAV